MRVLVVSLIMAANTLFAQTDAAKPLEALKVEHSVVSASVVQELAGLKNGQPINKSVIDEACQRLGQTALFSNVQYRYLPGPNHGYILTLDLQDETDLTAAIVDIPFVDGEEVWKWLGARYPTLQHKIPKADSGQDFVANEISAHVATALDGGKVVIRQQSDLATRRNIILLQPENLPHIASMEFTGVKELTSDQIAGIIRDTLKDGGFTEYNIRMFLEDAVRRAYEEHGLYRVQFPKVTATPAGKLLVNVKGEVVEGAQFRLGNVNIMGGPEVPVADMIKAAKFKTGELANWRDIQQSIVAIQKPMMRIGYKDAQYKTNRILDDGKKELNLEIPVQLGPLYHFGQVTFQGLAPDADAKAHQIWKKKPGEVYDPFYVSDFAGEFVQAIHADKVRAEPKEQVDGDHVVDLSVTFKKQTK